MFDDNQYVTEALHVWVFEKEGRADAFAEVFAQPPREGGQQEGIGAESGEGGRGVEALWVLHSSSRTPSTTPIPASSSLHIPLPHTSGFTFRILTTAFGILLRMIRLTQGGVLLYAVQISDILLWAVFILADYEIGRA